jgi:ABC-2 type transport system ATP-binding protein
MIELEHFCKRYGHTQAVKDVSFTAKRGEVTGLIGANGAGKSTILRALAGAHFPTSGRVAVCALDAREEPLGVRRLVGYVAEQPVFPPGFTAREHLHFLAQTLGVPASQYKATAALAGMDDDSLDTPCAALSRGYQQRLALAAALLTDPPVLVLDEPTSALDPLQARHIRTLIATLGETKTVLLSTHNLAEAEALCDAVRILHLGRLLFAGTLRDLLQAKKAKNLEEAYIGLTAVL